MSYVSNWVDIHKGLLVIFRNNFMMLNEKSILLAITNSLRSVDMLLLTLGVLYSRYNQWTFCKYSRPRYTILTIQPSVWWTFASTVVHGTPDLTNLFNWSGTIFSKFYDAFCRSPFFRYNLHFDLLIRGLEIMPKPWSH